MVLKNRKKNIDSIPNGAGVLTMLTPTPELLLRLKEEFGYMAGTIALPGSWVISKNTITRRKTAGGYSVLLRINLKPAKPKYS